MENKATITIPESLEKISVDAIRDFTAEAISTYAQSQERLDFADRAAKYLHDLLIWKGIQREGAGMNMATSFMISGTLLHNLFYDDKTDNWTKLFEARVQLSELADKYGVNKEQQEALFGTIEAVLGQKHPLANVRPQNGSPGDIVATAIWTVKREEQMKQCAKTEASLS